MIAAVRRYLSAIVRATPGATRQHGAMIALIAAYWVSGIVVCKAVGVSWTATITTYLPAYYILLAMMIAALIIGRGMLIVIVERPLRPLTQFVGEIQTSLASPQRMAHAAPLLVCMLIFGGTFTVIKSSIPTLSPFAWDATFEQWDRWIHGGTAPWQIFHSLFPSPVAVQFLNWNYNVWLVVLNLIWVWQAFSLRDLRSRSQFFLTFFLVFILLGNLAAILFSSAGPCYFGFVTGQSDPFAPLMAHLRAVDMTHTLWAVHTQDMLWEAHISKNVGLGVGISAMPSVHVGTATLFALIGWRTHRWLGIGLTVYAILILFGSVYLGWHYAIDGYAAALGTIAIWWLVGRLLQQRDKGRWIRLAPGSAVADEIAPR